MNNNRSVSILQYNPIPTDVNRKSGVWTKHQGHTTIRESIRRLDVVDVFVDDKVVINDKLDLCY